MNVALPALIVFFLLLPGYIFRTHLKRAERTSLDFSPFGQVAVEAILWALALHLLWLSAAHVIFRRDVDPVVLMELLSSAATTQASAADAVARQFNWVAFYFGTLICVSYVLPKTVRSIISRYRLDRADARFSTLFRFHQAPWYYLLTGADFNPGEEPDFIVVSAVVEVGKEPMLFVGVLDEFYVDAEGQLDRLVLQEVVRRPFSADKTTNPEADGPESRFYPIDGDSFVLRYSEAITLNVQYVRLTPESAAPTPPASLE
jgi:hypothetical protein